MSQKLNIDKLDLEIINIMMSNAEPSYAEIGKKLFVSAGTIHVRIKKLQEMGVVIGSAMKINTISVTSTIPSSKLCITVLVQYDIKLSRS